MENFYASKEANRLSLLKSIAATNKKIKEQQTAKTGTQESSQQATNEKAFGSSVSTEGKKLEVISSEEMLTQKAESFKTHGTNATAAGDFVTAGSRHAVRMMKGLESKKSISP